jgi:hypothetical protein
MQHHNFAVCVSRFKGNKSMLDSLCTECLSLCLPFVFLVFLQMTVWIISSYFLATLVFWLSHVCCTCHSTTWHEHSRGCGDHYNYRIVRTLLYQLEIYRHPKHFLTLFTFNALGGKASLFSPWFMPYKLSWETRRSLLKS